MKYIALIAIPMLMASSAFAGEPPLSPADPDKVTVTFTGRELGDIQRLLSEPVLYEKIGDGGLQPFIYPGVINASRLINEKMKAALTAYQAKLAADAKPTEKAPKKAPEKAPEPPK